MEFINNNIIDFTLEERGDHGLYDVKMYVNMVPYIGVFSYHVGFIHSSLENKDVLDHISNKIKKILENQV